jgi:hypothetical protein
VSPHKATLHGDRPNAQDTGQRLHILHHADCLREVNATIEQEKRFCVAVDLVRGGAPLSEIEAECNEKMRLDIFGSSSARRDVIIWHRVKAVSPRPSSHRTPILPSAPSVRLILKDLPHGNQTNSLNSQKRNTAPLYELIPALLLASSSFTFWPHSSFSILLPVVRSFR